MDKESTSVGHHLDTDMQAGTITALTMQQHQPTRVSVFLDGVFAFGVSQELVREWGLWVGRRLSVEDQVHLRAAEQLLTAQATALQYLAARPRTVHEVRQKLRRSGVADQVAEQVIARLQARGALDDAAYAHAYLTSRLASRGYGPQRLRQELHQRGIGRALVEEAVQQDLAAQDVLAAARAQAGKRWPAWPVKPILPSAGRNSGRSCAGAAFPPPSCSKSSRRWQNSRRRGSIASQPFRTLKQ